MKGNVSGYVCNHGSPSGERDTASPRLWAMLRTQASDEEADDVCSRRHLYCDTPVVTSWAVAGQQVVFLHMYLQTRVTLEAFPVATPRGRSVSFPTRGTMVTYVTWDVLYSKVSHFQLPVQIFNIISWTLNSGQQNSYFKCCALWKLKKNQKILMFHFTVDKGIVLDDKANKYYHSIFFHIIQYWY